jgi:preprotein translocase subunit SecD
VGYTDRKVPPDPAFTSYPSTLPSVADFDSSRTVLLPTAPGVGDLGYARYVLGPSELNGTDIAGARVVKVGGQWAVDITFTPAATVKWDAFVDANFHQMISIDLDGAVLSAPLIQPKQTSFSSLEGKFQLSGTFSAGQARRLASVFGKDPMPIALVRQSQRIVGPGLAH